MAAPIHPCWRGGPVLLAPLQPGDRRTEAEVEAIFFAASATQAFASDADRARFRERWLGRYLRHDPDLTLVAVAEDGTVLGYLVGARDDPARAPRFADIGYFGRLADLTARFPAHLHVNLAPASRGLGIGAALVAAFAERLAAEGVPGLHIVTAADARNRRFYERIGFAALRSLDWSGRAIVMMGRPLAVPDPPA